MEGLQNLSLLISKDGLFIITAVLTFLLYGVFFGKQKLVSLIISVYPATFLFQTMPFMSSLLVLKGEKLQLLNEIAVFFVLLILINIVISKFVSVSDGPSKGSFIARCAGLSLGIVVLVFLFSYSTVNFDIFHDFSPKIDSFFNDPHELFYWNLIPLILLAIL